MPSFYYALMLLLGLLAVPSLPQLYSSQILLVVTAIAALCLAPSRIGRGLVFFLGGFCIATITLASLVQRQVPDNLTQHDVLVDVTVEGPVTVEGQMLRMHAIVKGMWGAESGVCDGCAEMAGRKLRLSWRFPAYSRPQVGAGQSCHLRLRLKRPRGFVNFGGFDYQAWLLNQSLSATGYVKRDSSNICEQAGAVDGLARIRLAAQNSLNDLPHQGIFRALVTGDRSEISPAQWQVLQATGTTHLMAISGLHVGLLACFGFVVARLLMRFLTFHVAPLLYLTPLWRRGLPAAFGVALSGAYALLSGFAVPSQRAWLLVCLVSCLHVSGIKVNPLRLLLYVAIAVLVLNPLASTQNGFWLSFSAVVVLLYCFGFRVRPTQALVGLAYAQWAIFIALSVVVFARGLPVSSGSALANIVAVPVVSFIVLPGALLGSVASVLGDIGQPVLVATAFVMDWLWQYLLCVAEHSELWRVSLSHPLWLGVAVLGGFLLVAPRALPSRLAGATLLLAALFVSRSPGQDIRFSVLDVGQGLAAVLETPDGTAVFDVGARFSGSFDIGSRVVAPYLRYRGRSQVDLVAISHADNDHAGGLTGLVANIPVEQVFINEHDQHSEVPIQACVRGAPMVLPGVTVQVLWPEAEPLLALSRNQGSCVILLSVAGKRILITGDIDASVEQALISAGSLPTSVDILVAPHHGSASSSSYRFIQAVSPKHVIFSAGYRNRYRHPAARIVARYESYGAQIWRTDTDGAVAFTWQHDQTMHVTHARELEKRPWHD